MKTYVVEGSGSFPYDMLRYDRSYPATENDSALLERGGYRSVTLVSNSEYAGKDSSATRWSSFCWSVKRG